ncbi:hypothetical protein LCGC14_3153830, partial [marine sediment metagenome]
SLNLEKLEDSALNVLIKRINEIKVERENRGKSQYELLEEVLRKVHTKVINSHDMLMADKKGNIMSWKDLEDYDIFKEKLYDLIKDDIKETTSARSLFSIFKLAFLSEEERLKEKRKKELRKKEKVISVYNQKTDRFELVLNPEYENNPEN